MFRRLRQQFVSTTALAVLLAAGTMLSYRNLTQLVTNDRQVEQTSAILTLIETTASDVSRSEASSRAFVITGQQSYREKFQRWRTAAELDIDRLEERLAGNADAITAARNLRAATARVMDGLELAMSAREKEGPGPAAAVIQSTQQNTDEVRDRLAQMQQTEERVLQASTINSHRTAMLARTGVVVASILNIVLFGVWAYWALRTVVSSQRQQSRMGLATIADCSDDAIIGCDLRGFITSWNHGAERIFGYPAIEMSGISIAILSSDDLAPKIAAIFDKAVAGDRVDRVETTAVTKEGETVHVLLTVSPVRNASGIVTWVLLIARDITTEKRAEITLQKTAEQYRLIFDGNPLPMWVIDRQTLRFLAVNEAATRNYGYTREEFLGMTILDIRPPQDIPAVLEVIVNPATGLSRLGTWTHLRKDGTPIKVEITRHGMSFNGRDAELVLAHDVTERNKNEEKLRSSEERFSKAFQLSPVSISISSCTDARYLDVNQAFLELTGYTREEVIGHTADELNILTGDERSRLVNRLTETGRAISTELVFKTASGTSKFVQVSADLINLEAERCMLAITYDITQGKELEHQLRQAQKMEAVGRLAGGVAHDFNNMLGVISGYSDLARARCEHDPIAGGHIEEIRKAADRAASLTRQLLAFSRKQVLQPKTLNLNERIRDLGKLVQRLIGDDVELITKLGHPLDFINADPTQIDQVIMNLAVNARDAMPRGGKFIIETSCAELDETNIPHQHRAKPGKYVLLKVTDTGHGMDAETLSHIFEPFFTTKQPGKGTGLGLSTVHGIVSQSNGYIWVYSEPGNGTTFKIYLPATAKQPQLADARAPELTLARGSATILLAEDDGPMRGLTRHLLEARGYRVLEAADGDQALTLAQATRKGDIDLLITDVVMPRLSGPGLVERLGASHPNLKIIYTSGYTDELLAHHGAIGPGIVFLEKPFTRESLLQAVQTALGGSAKVAQAAAGAHAG